MLAPVKHDSAVAESGEVGEVGENLEAVSANPM
jgi:hypothetical protein